MNNIWIVCIDGSWNAPGQEDVDPVDHLEMVTKTNVQIVWEFLSQQMLDVKTPYGSIANLDQGGEIIYINGVGSSGSDWWRRFEGTTGTGTSERLLDAYRFLAERWQPGDKIFGFAFSRGAFALRSLVGLIEFVGLPKNRRLVSDAEIFELFSAYRDKPAHYAMSSGMQSATVNFIGVWDTVGALSFQESLGHFHNENPNNIEHFRHALALDEQRKQFLPIYFDAKVVSSLKEVWFIGAHSNVGGGYEDARLSNIALCWMLNEAKSCGLQLDLSRVPGWKEQSAEGEIRNSFTEFWNTMPDIGKLMERFGLEKVSRKIRTGQLIHESLLVSLKQNYKPSATPPAGETISALPMEKWFE